MADNSNVEAVKFANEKIRVSSDKLAQTYNIAKSVVNEWNANNLGTIFPSGDTVVDGSATDGRHPITGNDVAVIINILSGLIADFEATNNTILNGILNVAVNPIN